MPPPRIIEQPVNLIVLANLTATFKCVGQGYGLVDVMWYRIRSNKQKSLRKRSTVTTMTTPNNITTITSILNIPFVNDVDGRHSYICIYNNTGGQNSSMPATLTIDCKCLSVIMYMMTILLYTLLHLVPPPMIISHPMNIRVDNGSIVTFDCVSFSYAPVTYTWLRNGTLLDDDDVNIIISTDSDEDNNNYTTTLMILDVQLSDNGVYVCSATNRQGNVSSDTATLSVIGKLWFGCCICYYCITITMFFKPGAGLVS